MRYLFLAQTICWCAFLFSCNVARTETHNIQSQKILSSKGVIWSFDFIDDHTLIFNHRSGSIFIYDIDKKKKTQVVHDIPFKNLGQGGLLHLEKHPNFKKNKLIYFTYSVEKEKGFTTELGRAKLLDQKLVHREVLFTAKANFKTRHHYGSRMTFDDNNHIYMTIGDRGQRHNAQKLDNHCGKIVKLSDLGTFLPTNPFVKTNNALPEIWSYGHRNPQGIVWSQVHQKLWSNEHGPRGGDEINHIQKGVNYGWPIITYGKEYYGPKIGSGTHHKNMAQPLHYFVPSIAPSSLWVYQGDIIPLFKSTFLSGALALRHLNVVDLATINNNDVRLFESKKWRVRFVKQSENGTLYISTDSGDIYLIKNGDKAHKKPT